MNRAGRATRLNRLAAAGDSRGDNRKAARGTLASSGPRRFYTRRPHNPRTRRERRMA